MALPTKGRVIIDTTAGEIDVELWSKVCAKQLVDVRYFMKSDIIGNTKDVSQLHTVGYGR